MATPYTGNPVYVASITVMDDGDPDVAATYAVPIEQLADRAAYLKDAIDSGIGFEFTDAVLHGDTTFPDGTIGATVDSMSLVATGAISLASSGGLLFVGGNSFEVGATTTALIGVGTDLTINVGDDLAIDVNGDASLDVANGMAITGAGTIDIFGGKVIIPASGTVEIGTSVLLGGGGGDTVTVNANDLALGNTDLTGGTSCTVSLAGIVVFASTSDFEAAGTSYFSGKFRFLTMNRSNADFAVSAATGQGYEHILPDNPGGGGRTATLSHTGGVIGQRIRFNAQNVVTGADNWVIAYGARTWFMRNTAGKTVAIEFVSDGSAWVVDDHHEGGDALRNG